MPSSRLNRKQATFTDPSNAYNPNISYNINGWHEQTMDFNSYADIDQTTQIHQSISNATSMDGYLRPSDMRKATTPSEMFSPGPFEFSDLINMDSNTVSPLNISTASSVRSSSLSGVDTNVCPAFRAASNNGQYLSEKMCPLISGDTDVCEPSRCGPDAPCMNFTSLAPIEECATVPCMSQTDLAASPQTHSPLRSSSRLRRPIHTGKRSQTPLSSSSEDRKPIPARRPLPARTTTASEKPMSRMDKKQRAKQAHSLVEKKYRENLNTKLSLLHATLQNAQHGANRYNDAFSNDSDLELLDDEYADEDMKPRIIKRTDTGATGDSKFKKSEVLDDAMNYVNQTEVEMRHMETELIRLTERTKALEKALEQRGKCEDCSLLKRMVTLGVQSAG